MTEDYGEITEVNNAPKMFILYVREKFQEKYGSPPMLDWGSGTKLAKSLLAWAKDAFGDEYETKLRLTYDSYLRDTDKFLSGHPLAKFAKEPHRWAPKKPEPMPEKVHFSAPQKLSDAEWYDLVYKAINENPERFLKGFAITGKLLKKMNHDKYAEVAKALVSALGRERCIQVYQETLASTPINLVDTVTKGEVG